MASNTLGQKEIEKKAANAKKLIPEINRQKKTVSWMNPVFEIISWLVNVSGRQLKI